MPWMRLASSVMAAVVVVAGCETTQDAAVCDRACLVDLAHEVAIGAHALPEDIRVTENGANVQIADTWLERASHVNIHGEYAEVARGSVIVVGTGDDSDGRPSVFGLRLQQESGRLTEAELIVTHDGEASLFPPSTPIERQTAFSEIVPPGSRTPRSSMIEIADAYFDGIEASSGAKVPVTDDCNRIENGVQATNSDLLPDLVLKCNTLGLFDYITEVRERRFPVIDEERGVIVALVAFYIPGGDYEPVVDGATTIRHYDPRSLFLFEAFKIVSGKIFLIEATMRDTPLGTPMSAEGVTTGPA